MVDLITSREFQIGVVTGIAGVVAIYGLLALAGPVLRPWIRAKAAGADVGVPRLVGMMLRRVDANTVVEAYIRDRMRGGRHPIDAFEVAYLASGYDVRKGADLLELVEELARAKASSGVTE